VEEDSNSHKRPGVGVTTGNEEHESLVEKKKFEKSLVGGGTLPPGSENGSGDSIRGGRGHYSNAGGNRHTFRRSIEGRRGARAAARGKVLVGLGGQRKGEVRGKQSLRDLFRTWSSYTHARGAFWTKVWANLSNQGKKKEVPARVKVCASSDAGEATKTVYRVKPLWGVEGREGTGKGQRGNPLTTSFFLKKR